MKEKISVVLITRESAFKQYPCNRGDAKTRAYEFAQREAKIHSGTKYGILEKDSRTFVVVRLFDEKKEEPLPFVCVRRVDANAVSWVC